MANAETLSRLSRSVLRALVYYDLFDYPLTPQEIFKHLPTNNTTLEEVEAECFATMLLVPWTEFLKGTEPKYLAKDFGEQKDQVELYARYFKNPAVINKFRQVLWERGDKNHSIFGKV